MRTGRGRCFCGVRRGHRTGRVFGRQCQVRGECTILTSLPNRPSLVVCRCDGTVVVTLGGKLDAAAAELLELVLTDLVEGQGNRAVEIDLEEDCVLGPEALWVMRGMAERARRLGAGFEVLVRDVAARGS